MYIYICIYAYIYMYIYVYYVHLCVYACLPPCRASLYGAAFGSDGGSCLINGSRCWYSYMNMKSPKTHTHINIHTCMHDAFVHTSIHAYTRTQIQTHMNIWQTNQLGRTPLHLAVTAGDSVIVKYLMRAGLCRQIWKKIWALHILVHIYVYICVCIYIETYRYTFLCIYTCVYVYTYIYTYIHIHIYIRGVCSLLSCQLQHRYTHIPCACNCTCARLEMALSEQSAHLHTEYQNTFVVMSMFATRSGIYIYKRLSLHIYPYKCRCVFTCNMWKHTYI